MRHVAYEYMGDTRDAYRVLVGKTTGTFGLVDLDLGWRVILKWTLNY